MANDTNRYDIRFNLFSPAKGTTVRHYYVDANSFGEAEKKFDEAFWLFNDLADDLYGDDAVYEIIDIAKTNSGSVAKR